MQDIVTDGNDCGKRDPERWRVSTTVTDIQVRKYPYSALVPKAPPGKETYTRRVRRFLPTFNPSVLDVFGSPMYGICDTKQNTT